MPLNCLAKNVQILRKGHKLSQEQLAKKLHLSRSNIASYESGKAEPKASRLLQIAIFFDIGLEQLMEQDLSLLSESELKVTKKSAKKVVHFSVEQKEKIEQFVAQSKDLNKILEGFKEFYKFKLLMIKDMSGNLQNLSHDFENLLSIMEKLQFLNDEIINFMQESGQK